MICLTAMISGCQTATHTPPPASTPQPLPGELISLDLSESSDYLKRVQGYAFRSGNGTHTASFWLAHEDEPYPVPVDQAWVDTLTGYIRQYNMLSWDGYNAHFNDLLDGTSFTLALAFSDGTTVHARGYGRFPAGYSDASAAITAHFMQLLPEELRDW